jgi:hypothetical protein
MPNFTPEDLLLYLYKETSPEQIIEIEEELKNNWSLREKLSVMKIAMERLNNITVAPRTEIVLNILRHANRTKVSTSQS